MVFLCLEHGESSRVAGEVFDAGPGLVVDLAADFRVRDLRLYQRYYGPHAAPDLVPRFTYGLADVVGCRLRGAAAIAAPGCFATAAQLALYPLAWAGLDVEPVALRRDRLERRRRPAAAHDPPSRCGPTTCSLTRCWPIATRPRC